MTCAMRLHDPCKGRVSASTIPLGPKTVQRGVPLCEKHYFAWRGRCGPFRTWSRNERANWARWAADRARRQEAGQAKAVAI